MSTKVLVTGANGQLGSTIKELYSTNQDNIQFTFTTKAELDISKRKELQIFFKTNNFDYCINCAAFTNVEQAEKILQMAIKINAEAVKYLSQI
ncbi:MAG: sugar nucleotide-binding protein, partial [Bacteroidetes bacterium]|nr:sugar nucleotide-binding protein [Bacteroidota bacterium]